jgi:nucleoside-diphosphate-sugar epimerase
VGGRDGAIAAFAARALEGLPIVIPGDPRRTRDFLYVDDVVLALEEIARAERWGEPVVLSSGSRDPARGRRQGWSAPPRLGLADRDARGRAPRGENESYGNPSETGAGLVLPARSLDEGVRLYVDWLRRHPAAQGRAQA